jgi:hypothetical protein
MRKMGIMDIYPGGNLSKLGAAKYVSGHTNSGGWNLLIQIRSGALT